MKILLVHNAYQEPGGEDVVFAQERQMLERAGHRVAVYCRSNDEIKKLSTLGRVTLVKNSISSSDTQREFARLLDQETPDLVHVHNVFYMISPVVYGVCRERGIPVVQTLHNFRQLCPAATFYRDGKVCEECSEHGLWRGVYHGCYRNSRPATAAVALMLAWHRRAGTWDGLVDRYIALSEFSRDKIVAAGIPADKVVVKPNFVESDPGEREQAGEHALFVGRLAPEKGVSTLLQAWELLAQPYPLQIIGDGPEREKLEAQARQRGLSSIKFRGRLSREETITAIKAAQFLIVPSVWYEMFPMVIAEAFACGDPVLCSRLGALQDTVADNRTGLHFTAGDATDLARKVEWAFKHPEELAVMGREARREYETLYTSQRNYLLLMEIYERVLRERRASLPAIVQGRKQHSVPSPQPAGRPRTKIVLVHNAYREPGGEDVVFAQERQMLERAGHHVVVYRRSNDEIDELSTLGRLRLVKNSISTGDTQREFARLLDRENPDLVHIHNMFFMISPTVYSVCRDRGIPVVQTLHNFRLLCPTATFYRDGKVCEECAEHSLWRGVYHGCYRDSRRTTAAVALMLSWHRRAGTWNDLVDCYIALSRFSRDKFVAAGIPADKVVVKPNFVETDPGPRERVGKYVVFTGRLSKEKGLHTLLHAWLRLSVQTCLQIIGDGSERENLQAYVRRRGLSGITFRGRLSRDETIAAVKNACVLVFPSECYENFPMSIAEAFACGVPVICSRLGTMEEIVADGRTGLHFEPGDPEDLAAKVEWAWSHPREMEEMGRQARAEYEAKYTAERNYEMLMEIYAKAIAARGQGVFAEVRGGGSDLRSGVDAEVKWIGGRRALARK
jgi:glycosyltransferase involved in cell wall biosynthesis